MSDSLSYTIFTRQGFNCPWCDKAAELLDGRGLPYNLRPLTRAKLLEEAAKAHMSSIPIVYHGDRLVGGFEELKLYLEEQND